MYSGRCPGAQLAPEVGVDFGTGGGGGAFAVSDSVMDVTVRWRMEDTLEVIYPRTLHVSMQRPVLQYGTERVYVVYAAR